MYKISPIKAFSDNYIWSIVHGSGCYVVDPGDAVPVQTFLKENSLSLEGILVTHWHPDHIGGIEALSKHNKIKVFGPKSEHIPQVNHHVVEGDKADVLGLSFDVLEVPGHTLDHIAYFSRELNGLFCGDTLFAGGCGRIFEGTPEMMHSSLHKLVKLPGNTDVYCAHEYTLANLQFAIEVEPGNTKLRQRLIECEQARIQGQCTLPTTIELELETNPFLRVSEEEIITNALNQGADSDKAVDIFAQIREWKNNF